MDALGMTKAWMSVVVPKSSRMMVTAHSAIKPRCTSSVSSAIRVRKPGALISVDVSTLVIVSDETWRNRKCVARLLPYQQKGDRLSQATPELPRPLVALRTSSFSEEKLAQRSVKDEIRKNLICAIQRGESLFPGIIRYEGSVVQQV